MSAKEITTLYISSESQWILGQIIKVVLPRPIQIIIPCLMHVHS